MASSVMTLSTENSEDIECFIDISTCDSFAGLPNIFDYGDEAHMPEFLSTEHVEGRVQQRFELMCRNRKRPSHSIEHMAIPTIARFYSIWRQKASLTGI